MKNFKLLLCLLIIATAALFVGTACGGETETTVSGTTEVTTAATTTAATTTSIDYSDKVVKPAEAIAADQLKVYGRSVELTDGAISCDFTASGIEFSAYCKGDVKLNISVSRPNNGANGGSTEYGYFTVWVDGVRIDNAKRVKYPELCGDRVVRTADLVLATGLEEGLHTFKVLKQNNPRNNIAQINSISFTGELADRPADRDLFIEFIGDSYTTAYGNLGVDKSHGASSYGDGNALYEDGTQSYAYLAADKLEADWSIIARPGIGVAYGTDDEQYQMSRIYHLNCFWRDNKAEFSVGRVPNLVVMYLGTNDDWQITSAAKKQAFEEKYRGLIDEVIGNYGAEVKILLLDNTSLNNARTIIAKIGADYDNVTVLPFTQYKNGYGAHANVSECNTQATTLASDIRRLYPELFTK